MLVYNFNAMTLAYTGATEALPDMEHPTGDAYLLPAWAVWEPPPEETGKTAFWVNGAWELRTTTPHEALTEFINKVEPPEVKKGLLLHWADLNLENAAVALGFKNMADALTYVDGPTSQRSMDAVSLRAWRNNVMAQTDFMVKQVMERGADIPSLADYAKLIPKFSRNLFQPTLFVNEAPIPVYSTVNPGV